MPQMHRAHGMRAILRTLGVVVLIACAWHPARAGQSPSPAPTDRRDGWRLNGSRAADVPYRRSANGLGGWLLVTDDADWQKKWDTPFENTPHFSEVDSLSIGERVTMLILISNAKRDTAGRVDVACDIRVRRADGSLSIDAKGVACLQDPGGGRTDGIALALPQIVFVGEESDPLGEWILDVKVIDRVRMVELPLRRVITLKRRLDAAAPEAGAPARPDEVDPSDRD